MSSGSRGPATAGARVLGRRGRVVVTRDDGAGGPSLAGQAYASSPFTLRGKTIGSRYVYLTLISQARPRCCWPTVRPRRSTQRSRRSTRRARPRAAGLPIPSGAAQDRRRQRQPGVDDPQRTQQSAGGLASTEGAEGALPAQISRLCARGTTGPGVGGKEGP